MARPSATRCRSPEERPDTGGRAGGRCAGSAPPRRPAASSPPSACRYCAADTRCSAARSCAGRARTAGTRRRCRVPARLCVTSSPARKIEPEVGSSSPAIMRSRRLAAAGRAEETDELPVLHGEGRGLHRGEVAEILGAGCARRSSPSPTRELGADDEHRGAGKRHREGPAVEREREGLHEHDDPERDDDRRGGLGDPARREALRPQGSCLFPDHLRTARR